MTTRPIALAGAIAVALSSAGAQEPARPRPLAPPNATSAGSFRNISQIRQLSDGRVLVHDARDRRVILLDAKLANPIVVVDSAAGRPNSYGSRIGMLFPYLADSSLFYDGTSQAFLVIDPAGGVARVMAVPPLGSTPTSTVAGVSGAAPSAADRQVIVSPPPAAASSAGAVSRIISVSPALTSTTFGVAAFDGRGRLVYGATMPYARPFPPAPSGPEVTTLADDSSRVMAVDLASRTTTVVASIKRGGTVWRMTATSSYNDIMQFPAVDEWAMLSDGTVAVLRGRDYHVDLIAPDGSTTALPRLSFPWKRLTDDDKQHMADSIYAVRKKEQDQIIANRAAADSAAKVRGAVRAAGETEGYEPLRPVEHIRVTELPDYLPAFARGALRADADGNLWIRQLPSGPAADGVTYEIMNRGGAVTDRVAVATGQSLIGFGGGGNVYLMAVDGGTARLLRTRLK